MMANFNIALPNVLKVEGRYVNDPSDNGGETYLGITRRDHPDWPGWAIVDPIKHDGAALAAKDPQLKQLAYELYKKRYWDRFDGDSISSQKIAEELFDTGVNMGIGRAVTFLQKGLNVLNKRASLWPEIGTDGDMGPKSRAALNACLAHHDELLLLRVMNILQGAAYLEFAAKDERQEVFIKGWLNNRVFNQTELIFKS